MSVAEIEAAITNLPPTELAQLMAWLDEHYETLWDRQIEEDLETGRFDKLLSDVDREYDAGLAQPL